MSDYKTYTDRMGVITPNLCNYRLLPFSLGHVMLLKGANSNFINGAYDSFCDINNIHIALASNPLAVISEFMCALMICTTTYDEFKEEMGNGKIRDTINEFRQTIVGKEITSIVDGKEVKSFEGGINNITELIHTFAYYLKNGTDAPLYDVIEKEGSVVSDSSIDSEETIKNTLMSHGNYTRNDALNLPLTETLSAYIFYAHENGGLKIRSKQFNDLVERMKKERDAKS